MSTARSTTRGPRSDATENRETILHAAAAALNDDPDASIETIAARAGLSRRAVYGHFAGRDELVADVLARGAARVGSSVLPLAHSDPLVEIALFGATLWSEVEHVRVMARFAVRGPHQHRVADALAPARRRLRETIERGAASGAVRTDIDAATVARLVEAAALAVLDEAAQQAITREAGHRLVMLSGLAAAGLGWRDADDLIDRTPELAFVGDRGNPSDPARHGTALPHASRGLA